MRQYVVSDIKMEIKMTTGCIRKSTFGLGVLVATLGAALISPKANAAPATTRPLPPQEFKIAHCCHPHPYSPYDDYCCHPPSAGVYVAPRVYAPRVYAPRVYGVGPASVRGVSRRTSRRVYRRR